MQNAREPKLGTTQISRLNGALDRTRAYLLSSQRPDGSWSGAVESDPRATAFYLNTIRHLGRDPDDATREMEAYLSSTQLDCGAWQAWPGGAPDVDVTTVCTLALQIADTEPGLQARRLAQRWLSTQARPEPDSFWRGLLALDGHLSWGDLPYLSPRIVANPDWLHPNIYDFSFLRIAIVSASLLQTCAPLSNRRDASNEYPSQFDEDFGIFGVEASLDRRMPQADAWHPL